MPVAQLACVGGSAQCDARYAPKVVQCTNQGSDGFEVQWDCRAELEPAVRFGTVQVSCEGFSKPGDSLVLAGSCGLQYHLELTARGKKRRRQHGYSEVRSTSSAFNLFLLAAVALLIFVIYRSFIAPSQSTSDYSSPPPYEDRRSQSGPPPFPPAGGPPPPGFKPEYAQTSGGWRRQQPQYEQQQQGPGFWTGAGLGSLMGYMFGSSSSTCNSGYGGYGGYGGYDGCGGSSWQTGGSTGWFGAGGASRRRESSSGSSSEGASRTAHGYGGTSVR